MPAEEPDARAPDERRKGLGLFARMGAGGWVCMAAILAILYGLAWGMPRLWDTAADSVVPEGILAAQSRDFTRLTSGRYPPLHFHLLRVVFLGADGVVWLDRAAGTGAFANPKLLSAVYTMSARFLSAAMGVATVMLVFWLTRRMFGQRAAVFASVAMIACPLTQYYSKNANLDIPYVFWLALALWFLHGFFEEGRGRALIWAGLAAAAAVCTKDQAYGFLALFPIPVLWTLRKRRGSWGKALSSGYLWKGLGLAAFAFALAHGIFFAPERFVEHTRVIAGPASAAWRETGAGPAGQARLLTETLLRTVEALTAPVAIAAVVGAAMAWGNKGRWILWGPLGYWLTFLAVVGYVYPRFVLPVALALAPFAGLALDRLWRWKAREFPAGAVAAVLILAWPAARCGALLIDMDLDTRRTAQLWIEKNVQVSQDFGYLGPERDMPQMNREDLDARRLELRDGRFIDAEAYDDFTREHGRSPTAEETGEMVFSPEVLVLSKQKPREATVGFGEWALRSMGGWGRIKYAPRKAAPEKVRAEFRLAARFDPPLGWLSPNISPSTGRTIEVWERKE